MHNFLCKVDGIKHINIMDVSARPVELIWDSDVHIQKDQYWSKKIDPIVITDQEMAWIYENEETEKIFKITLTNDEGETKTIFQIAFYSPEFKKAIEYFIREPKNLVHEKI